MSYLHIPNLYQDQRIQEFRRVYCLEKIHGTPAHVSWRNGKELKFSSGGEDHDGFVSLFDQDTLTAKFREYLGWKDTTVYGEAYGGKQQRMSATYGPELKFVVFDIKIDNCWLAVPQASSLAEQLGLEFVSWELTDSDTESLDKQRNADSVQAIRNGMGSGKKREGIVIRPPFEVTLNNGERLIAKHKNDAFRETKSPRVVGETPKVLEEASLIADEWVTPMRLQHVIDKLPEVKGMSDTGTVVRAMLEDIAREAAGEIVESKASRKAISTRTAKLWKQWLEQQK